MVTGAGGELPKAGLVASLATPGGKLTGVQVRNDETVPQKLEVLKALVPTLSRLAFLREDVIVSSEMIALHDQQVVTAARSLGLKVHPVTVHRSQEFTNVDYRFDERKPRAVSAGAAELVQPALSLHLALLEDPTSRAIRG